MVKKTDKKEPEQNPIEPTKPNQEPEFEELPEEIRAVWEFPEFEKHNKGRWWYIIYAVIIVALLIYSYFADNMLFAIIIVIFTVLYLTLDNRGPRTINFMITDDGIVLNGKLIVYEDLENFYIIYYPPQIKNLYFQPKNGLSQRIAIPLGDQNPVTIRHILLDYLEEDLDKEEAPSSENISRLLKL